MSERKSFFRTAKKQFSRQQEKIRQKLVKGEHVEDEEYDEHVANFQSQAMHATRLHKEVGNYIKAVRAMATASRSLGDAIKTIYDPEWDNSEEAYNTIETLDQLYMDLVDKLQDEVLDPLASYTSQFQVIKARMAKRDRRSLDYDRARRVLDHAKEKNNTHKTQQAREAFDKAQHQFEAINSECHDMLPSFYKGRVSFFAAVLQSYFASEAVFHGACQSVHGELQEYVETVAENAPSNSHAPRIRPLSEDGEEHMDSDRSGPSVLEDDSPSVPSKQQQQQPRSGEEEPDGMDALGEATDMETGARDEKHATSNPEPRPRPRDKTEPLQVLNAHIERLTGWTPRVVAARAHVVALPRYACRSCAAVYHARPSRHRTMTLALVQDTPAPLEVGAGEELPEILMTRAPEPPESDSAPEPEPSDVIEVRVAAHAYEGQDTDELTLARGDVIEVIPFEDPEDEEEGWLFGRLKDGQKGVFPRNHTRLQKQ